MKKIISKFNFNQVLSIVQEHLKKKPLVDAEKTITKVPTDILTPKKEITLLLRYKKMKAEKEHWEEKYNSLLSDLQAMKKLEKQIKSRI